MLGEWRCIPLQVSESVLDVGVDYPLDLFFFTLICNGRTFIVWDPNGPSNFKVYNLSFLQFLLTVDYYGAKS